MTEITASLEYLFCYRFNVRNDLKKVFICHLPTAPSNHTSNYTIAFKEKNNKFGVRNHINIGHIKD